MYAKKKAYERKMKEKVKIRKERGITLIALVVTIIVLLILAGVTITMLSGQNGVLTNAQKARRETSESQAKEQINLMLNAIKTEIYSEQVSDKTYSGLVANNEKTEITQVDSAITKIIKDDANLESEPTISNSGKKELTSEGNIKNAGEGWQFYLDYAIIHKDTRTKTYGEMGILTIAYKSTSNDFIAYGRIVLSNITTLETIVEAVSSQISGDGKTGITIDGVKITTANAKDYYGKAVDYHPTIDGKIDATKYRVFYCVTEEDEKAGRYGKAGTIFLKRDWTSNNVSLNDTDTEDLYTKVITNDYQGTDEAVEMMRKMNPDWAKNENDKTTWTSLTQDNEKEVTWLCDTTKWEKYVDSSKADYAIGSPSAEMYCASYNSVSHSIGNYKVGAKYNEGGVAFGCSLSVPGYIYTLNGSKSTISNYDYWTGDNTIDYQNYNSMYCGKDGKKENYNWWLASPSSGFSDSMCLVHYYASLGGETGRSSNGLCPLVSLKSGITLTTE